MRKLTTAVIGVALIASIAVPAAQADSIAGVEGARAKERQGRHLNRTDREYLHRYGGNDDYRWRGPYRDYDSEYYDEGGPGVSVYVGPGGVGVYGD